MDLCWFPIYIRVVRCWCTFYSYRIVGYMIYIIYLSITTYKYCLLFTVYCFLKSYYHRLLVTTHAREIPYTTLHIIILSPVRYIHAWWLRTSTQDPSMLTNTTSPRWSWSFVIRNIHLLQYTYFNQGTVCSSIMHFHKSILNMPSYTTFERVGVIYILFFSSLHPSCECTFHYFSWSRR